MGILRKRLSLLLVVLLLAAVALSACDSGDDGGTGGGNAAPSGPPALRIVSGSENESLEPIIQEWARKKGIVIEVTYLGSLDIMLEIEDGVTNFDAVWPANGIWITLGDQYDVVKHDASILRSPVVLGVKRSIADRLGWTAADVEVTVDDILAAAEADEFDLMMTSATQSNSGASAYLAFLYAFADKQGEALTLEDLEKPEVAEKIKRILGTVDRSSGSSGWLMDLCLDDYDECDAMVNYEALIIEANQELARLGKEPLYAIYPADGLAIADSPLGYVDKGDADKEALFLELQAYLLSDPVQQQIIAKGRRAGLVGMDMTNANRAVFNPDWGIDPARTPASIIFPRAEVIRQALNLYQVAFRKPSFTVYALDYSSSMMGVGNEQLVEAMRTLLDQERAAEYLLQASPDDITVVLLFNEGVINEATYTQWMVRGNDPAELQALFDKIAAYEPGGNTNIYDPVRVAYEIMNREGVGNRFPAVILMSDGFSNEGVMATVHEAFRTNEYRAPVFGILFGAADERQMKEIADYTTGRVFDGQTNLIEAFRKAKGYN